MAKFFINRPVFAIVIALFITIAGFLCMFTLPVDRYPTITPPQISVRANYPGADSDVVEQTVAEVIEKQVTGVEGFDNMSSTSNADGSYSLTVQFLSGTDEDMANVRVQNAVQQADASLRIRCASWASLQRSPLRIWLSSSALPRRTALTTTSS